MFLDGERKKSCTTLSARSLTLPSFTFELSPLRPHHFNIGDVQSVCPRGAPGGAGFFPFQGCILGLVFQAILKCRGGGETEFSTQLRKQTVAKMVQDFFLSPEGFWGFFVTTKHSYSLPRLPTLTHLCEESFPNHTASNRGQAKVSGG